jgi:hypothetical protein
MLWLQSDGVAGHRSGEYERPVQVEAPGLAVVAGDDGGVVLERDTLSPLMVCIVRSFIVVVLIP